MKQVAGKIVSISAQQSIIYLTVDLGDRIIEDMIPKELAGATLPALLDNVKAEDLLGKTIDLQIDDSDNILTADIDPVGLPAKMRRYSNEPIMESEQYEMLAPVEDVVVDSTTPLIKESVADAPYRERVTVLRVIDGDTIQVESEKHGVVSVRLVGVNTREMPKVYASITGQVGGREAARFLEQLLSLSIEKDAAGRSIVYMEWGSKPELEWDVYHSRRLGIVYVPIDADGNYINACKTIIKNGYSDVYKYKNDPTAIDEQGDVLPLFNEENLDTWDALAAPVERELSHESREYLETAQKIRYNYDNRDQLLGPLHDYSLRIGDVQFTVPPLCINVMRQSLMEKIPSLRSKGSIKHHAGKVDTLIEIELFFDGFEAINGKEILEELICEDPDPLAANPHYRSVPLPHPYYINGLRSLIAQFKKCPFVPIQNKTLNEQFGIEAVCLVSMTATTLKDFPGAIKVILKLTEFDITAFIPDADSMDSMIIWPLFRWYYQRSMQNIDKRHTYLQPITRREAANAFTFMYVPSLVEDKYEYMRPGTERLTDANVALAALNIISHVQNQAKEPTSDFQKEAWDAYVIKQALIEYEYYKEHGKLQDNFFGIDSLPTHRANTWFVADKYFYPKFDPRKGLHGTSGLNTPPGWKWGQDVFILPLKSEIHRGLGFQLTKNDAELDGYEYLRTSDLVVIPASDVADLYDINLKWELIDENFRQTIKKTEKDLPLNEYPIPGLILTSLQIGLQNTITTLQADSRQKPTYQYLGSQDTILRATFRADEKALQMLDELIRYTNEASRVTTTPDFMQTPDNEIMQMASDSTELVVGFLQFKNELAQLFGVDTVLVERIDYSTVQGLPGQYDVVMTMVDFQRTQKDMSDWFFLSGAPEDPNDTDALTRWDAGTDISARRILKQLSKIELYPDLELPLTVDLVEFLQTLDIGVPSAISSTGKYVEPDFYMLESEVTAEKMLKAVDEDRVTMEIPNADGETEEFQITSVPSYVLKETAEELQDVSGSMPKHEVKPTDNISDVIKYHESDLASLPQGIKDAYEKYGFYYDYVRYDRRGRLARAFPTFQLFIIDEGKVYGVKRLYDNFYGVNGVFSIRVHKSKTIAADTIHVTFSNQYKRVGHSDQFGQPYYFDEVRGKETSIWHLAKIDPEIMEARARERLRLNLQTGTRVHVRMGYGSNASDLPIVFNGKITELAIGDIVQFIAQSDALELVNLQVTKEIANGVEPQNFLTNFLATNNAGFGNLLRQLTWGRIGGAGGNLKHLGRVNMPPGMNAESVSEGVVFEQSVHRKPTDGDEQWWYDHLRNKIIPEFLKRGWLPGEVADNIWKANGKLNAREYPKGFLEWFNTLISLGLYNAWDEINVYLKTTGKTGYDILQAMAYCVPDYIGAVAPFEFRSTVFYGKPYWPYAFKYKDDYEPKNPNAYLGLQVVHNRDEEVERKMNLEWKPFMQLHAYNSITDIISNQIRCSSAKVFNQTRVTFATSSGPGSLTVYADSDIDPEEQKLATIETDLSTDPFKGNGLLNNLGRFIFDGLLGIPFTRTDAAHLLSNIFLWRPVWAFAANTQAEFLRNMYQGSLTVIGDPAVKPYDMIGIADYYSDLYGPVTVRSVTHIFDFSSGFITVIEPDAAVVVEDPVMLRLSPVVTAIAVHSGVHILRILAGKYRVPVKILRMALQMMPKKVRDIAVQLWMADKLQDYIASGRVYAEIMQKSIMDAIETWILRGMDISGTGRIARAVRSTSYAAAWVLDHSVSQTTRAIMDKAARSIVGRALLRIGGWLISQGTTELIVTGISSVLERTLRSKQACIMTPLKYRGEYLTAGITGHSGLVTGDRPKVHFNSRWDILNNLTDSDWWAEKWFNMKRYYYEPHLPPVDTEKLEIEVEGTEHFPDTILQFDRTTPVFSSPQAVDRVLTPGYEPLDVTQQGDVDLITVDKYHPEVIEAYKTLCAKMQAKPYGGGTILNQKSGVGRVVVGYIDAEHVAPSNCAESHLVGRALDIYIGAGKDWQTVYSWMVAARNAGFNRIGYDSTIQTLHVDTMPNDDMTPYWIQTQYTHEDFMDLETLKEWLHLE